MNKRRTPRYVKRICPFGSPKNSRRPHANEINREQETYLPAIEKMYKRSHAHPPYPPPTTNTQPIIALTLQPALRRPADIAHLIITHPARNRRSLARRRRTRDLLPVRPIHSAQTPLTQQIPDQNQGVVSTGGQCSSSRGGPFYAVDGCAVAFEFEEGLTRLPDVEDADAVAVLGEGGEEVGVVGGCGEAEEGRGVGHCLLR